MIEPIQIVVFKLVASVAGSNRLRLNLYRLLYLNLIAVLYTRNNYQIEPIQIVVFKLREIETGLGSIDIEPIQIVVFKYT